ncbi:MAG: hypothetical protein AAF525_13215 [Pseudomonadota bacterium]
MTTTFAGVDFRADPMQNDARHTPILLLSVCLGFICTASASSTHDTGQATGQGNATTTIECVDDPAPSDSLVFSRTRSHLLLSDSPSAMNDTSAQPSGPWRIGQVRITRLSVFDTSQPKENNALYRWANRFHVMTREDVVRDELLFQSGDPYDANILSESARLLRQRDHLSDATIRVISVCDDTVDIEVVTQDVWSFTPEASFDRSGGQDLYTIGMRDTNLFGTGSEWSIAIREDLDRRSVRTVVEDENWRGSRVAVSLLYDDSDDGRHAFTRIQQPFYALDTRSAWLVSQDNLRRETGQYAGGTERSRILEDIYETRIWYGRAIGERHQDHIVRWKAGWVYRDEAFATTTDLPAPTPSPNDQVLSYPWISLEGLTDRFATITNLNQIHRTEDIYVGQSWRARIGHSHPSLGATRRHWIADLGIGQTLHHSARTLLQHQASAFGKVTTDGHGEDVLLRYRVHLYHRQHRNRSWLIAAQLDWSDGLRAHRQLSLGGLNGARGFSNRFQTGTRRWQITAEHRWFTDIHFLNLVRVGYATFLDAGHAWRSPISGNPDGTLANVGVGLRLASSKSDVGKVAHIDLAFPMTHQNEPGVQDFELTATIKNSF